MLGQVFFTFLLVVAASEVRTTHIDKTIIVSHLYRHVAIVNAFYGLDQYLMAGRSSEGASTFCAKGYKFPASSLYRLPGLGCRCVSNH